MGLLLILETEGLSMCFYLKHGLLLFQQLTFSLNPSGAIKGKLSAMFNTTEAFIVAQIVFYQSMKMAVYIYSHFKAMNFDLNLLK